MKMTFQQYIDNPLGKKNSVFSNRNMYKDLYTKKLDTILVREAGKIQYILYLDKNKDQYYCHIKIPSEVVPKFYYDVVIEFYTDDNANRTDNDLSNYQVRFFSNDPSFVFTYLRVFLKNDMFIEDLKSKSPAKALKDDPVERNPFEIPGYVKSVYFAYLYMKAHGLFLKQNYKMYGKNYSKKALLNDIEHADKKIQDRQDEGEKLKKEEKKKERDKADSYDRNRNVGSKTTPVNTTPYTSKTKVTTASGKNVLRTKTSNKTKKI